MMADPLPAGAVKLTIALPQEATAITPVGASGTPCGVTRLEVADGAPVPTLLLAVTLQL